MKDKKLSRKGLWILALVVLLIGTILAAVPAAAKYITVRNNPQNTVDSYNFYFRSNVLPEWKTGDTPQEITIPGGAEGTTSFSFELYNFDDELRIADLQINYVVTLHKDGDTNQAATVATGHLSANARKKAAVELTGLENGASYTVTAVGSNGYSKTLKAVIKVDPATPRVYKHLDTSNPDYVLLTVWTEGTAHGSATVTYPDGLIPDNTDPAMRGWTESPGADSSSFTGLYASHQYRFFTDDKSGLTAGSFTVAVGGITASESTP